MLNDLLRTLRGIATANLGLKLVSVACALLLYSLAHGAPDAERTIWPSVEALMPENLNRVLVTPLPATLRVALRGPRGALHELRVEDLGPIVVDVRAGQSRVTFDPAGLKVPAGVIVDQIDPPFVDLAWESRITREIPVQVGVVGAPAPGFVVKSLPVAEPALVHVSGPESEVEVIQRVRGEPFDVSGLGEGKQTRQIALDRHSGRVTFSPTSVTVTTVVGREVSERTFARIPLSVLGAAKGRAQPADVDVRVSCPPEIVRALRAEQILPRVRVTTGAEHGTEAMQVELNVERCEAHATPENVVVRW